MGDTAFGGSVISQALSAAVATVEPGFDEYSSQASFLRHVKATDKVFHHVGCAANGRNLATRIVRATQNEACPYYYAAIISFQRRRSVFEQDTTLRYTESPPELGGSRPGDTPRHDLKQVGFQINTDGLPANIHAENPFDGHLLPFKPYDDPSQIRAHGPVRLSPQGTSSNADLPSIAMLSDQSLLELVIFANWDSTNEGVRRLTMNTTLNSQVSFHVPAVESTMWMICESRNSWGSGGWAATQ